MAGPKFKPVLQRLEALIERIPESGCWIFMGSLNRKGYGQFRVGSMKKAHRVSYHLHIGEIPDNMLVCHSCDVPSCVNPSHLFLGTHQDNMADRGRKGRTVNREKSGGWKGGYYTNNPFQYHKEYLKKWRQEKSSART